MAFGESPGWTVFATLSAAGSITLCDAVTGGRHVILAGFIGVSTSSASNTVGIFNQATGATLPMIKFGAASANFLPLNFGPYGLAAPSLGGRLVLNSTGTGMVTVALIGVTRV